MYDIEIDRRLYLEPMEFTYCTYSGIEVISQMMKRGKSNEEQITLAFITLTVVGYRFQLAVAYIHI